MATQYIGVDRGAQRTTITTGTSTTSKTLEVTVNLAGNMTRAEVYRQLNDIADYILDTRTTPFAQ
jgi:hypothetical protein